MMRSRVHIGILHSIAAILARTAMASAATSLIIEKRPDQWPIVYAPEYNIKFYKLEKLHVFDSCKWERIFNFLKDAKLLSDENVVKPREATESDLLFVHTKKYLDSLKWSTTVARVTEVLPVMMVPNFLLQSHVLSPMRHQTGGTILATQLAIEHGWAINIGGGFHHSSSNEGGGFCVYADISLGIKYLFENKPHIKKAMIIDLDAHQGNGHERDFAKDDRVYIMDVYNRRIYPRDIEAKRSIKRKVEILPNTKDEEFLGLVVKHVNEVLDEFKPEIVVYNAGTDIMEGDPLGELSISPKGIIERDEIVFKETRKRGIPIVMVTSGGYQMETARVIADSILNLNERGYLAEKYQDKLMVGPSFKDGRLVERSSVSTTPATDQSCALSSDVSMPSHSETTSETGKQEQGATVDETTQSPGKL